MGKTDEHFNCSNFQEVVDTDYEVEKLRIKSGNYTMCYECKKKPAQHEAFNGMRTVDICSGCAFADRDLPKEQRKYSNIAW